MPKVTHSVEHVTLEIVQKDERSLSLVEEVATYGDDITIVRVLGKPVYEAWHKNGSKIRVDLTLLLKSLCEAVKPQESKT